MKKQMFWMNLPLLSVGAVIALSWSSCAQDAATNSQPHFPGQAPGELQQVFRQLEGRVSAVDSKAMTLELAGEPDIFKITAKTQITRDNKPASLGDIAVNQTVKVAVRMMHAQPNELASVNIKTN
jgi:hypothetical protein